MLEDIKKSIEKKRGNNSLFWKLIIIIKDFLWIFGNLFYVFFRMPFFKISKIAKRIFNSKKEFADYKYKKFNIVSDFPVFCINLEKRKDKKIHMEREFRKAGFDYIFVKAVDANDLNINDLKKKKIIIDKKGEGFGTTAIGCYLSHIKLWKRMINKKIPLALICEDDIFFKANKKKIINSLKNMPDDAEVIYLDLRFMKLKILNEHVALFKHKDIVYGTSCYFLTLKGAKKLLNNAYPLELTLDHYINHKIKNKDIKAYAFSQNFAGSLSKRPSWPESYASSIINKFIYKQKIFKSDIAINI